MHSGCRPIRIAMSIAIFRVVVVLWTVVKIRVLDPIPGLGLSPRICFVKQWDGRYISMAYLVLLFFRLSVTLASRAAKCGSMAWLVLCPTTRVVLRVVDRRYVT